MTLRDELIEIVLQLPEEALERVAPALREADEGYPRFTMAEALERADAFRASIEWPEGTMPDVVEMINEMREERINDILNSLR